MQVLLLEPDFWRFLGLSQVLKSEPGIKFLGEENHTRILELDSPPADLLPDVVLVSHSLVVDYQMSVLDHLRKLFPQANILVDGYDGKLDSVAEVLRAGAKGYFLLSSDPTELVKAIAIVEKGRIWAPREALVRALQDGSELSGPASERAPLSKHESSLLTMLGQGLSNKEIAQRLGVAEVTVKSHMTKLFRKFGVKTRLELLAYAVSHHLISERGIPVKDA